MTTKYSANNPTEHKKYLIPRHEQWIIPYLLLCLDQTMKERREAPRDWLLFSFSAVSVHQKNKNKILHQQSNRMNEVFNAMTQMMHRSLHPLCLDQTMKERREAPRDWLLFLSLQCRHTKRMTTRCSANNPSIQSHDMSNESFRTSFCV